MGRTCLVCIPFCPCSASNETRCPSMSSRYPLPSIDEKWAKTSGVPSSGVMNPKPLVALNHFTVPAAMMLPHFSTLGTLAGDLVATGSGAQLALNPAVRAFSVLGVAGRRAAKRVGPDMVDYQASP